MKFVTKFIIVVLIIIVIFGTSFALHEKYFRGNILGNEILKQLESLTRSKAERVKDFLEERKQDARMLSMVQEINDSFIQQEVSAKLENYLLSFKEINEYVSIILINKEGKILYTSESGLTKGSAIPEDSILLDLFEDIKNDLGVGVSDPGTLSPGGTLSIFITMPILVTEESGHRRLEGMIALQVDNEKIKQLITEEVGIEETGELYAVNRDRNNITDLKFDSERIELEELNKKYRVHSGQITNCFLDYDNYYLERQGEDIEFISKSNRYRNYAGKKVFGSHEYILQSGWCIMAEIVEKDYYRNLPFLLGTHLLYYLLIIVVFSIVLLVICKNFLSRYKDALVLLIVGMLLISLSAGLWVYKIYFIEDTIFTNQVHNHLYSLASSRSERVKDYILERQNDSKVLANSFQVREAVVERAEPDLAVAKRSIDRKTEESVKELYTYLQANPNVSIDSLRASQEFKEVAIRPFGETGLISVLEDTTPVDGCPYSQNCSLNFGFDDTNKRLQSLANTATTKGESSGEYEWLSNTDFSCRKYASFKKVGKRTPSGKSLISWASSCITDYQIIKNTRTTNFEYLHNFEENLLYDNIVLLSEDGRVVFSGSEMNELGLDVDFLATDFAESYRSAKERDEVIVYGPYREEYSNTLKLSFISPIYNEQRKLGYVALLDTMDHITGIMTELTGLGETGDNYLVNKNRSLLTPVRFKVLDLLTQSIETKNMESCLIDARTSIQTFDNYLGDYSYGTNQFIQNTDWCLLTEVGVREVFELAKHRTKN